VTNKRQSAPVAVSRSYRREPDACERAVALLLEKRPVSKQGGHSWNRPDDAKVRSTND
jgi:hypothetical protein